MTGFIGLRLPCTAARTKPEPWKETCELVVEMRYCTAVSPPNTVSCAWQNSVKLPLALLCIRMPTSPLRIPMSHLLTMAPITAANSMPTVLLPSGSPATLTSIARFSTTVWEKTPAPAQKGPSKVRPAPGAAREAGTDREEGVGGWAGGGGL